MLTKFYCLQGTLKGMPSRDSFLIIVFLVSYILTFSGCTKLSWLRMDNTTKKDVPKEITYTVQKWQPIGLLSEELPTVIRVLKLYTGSMSVANSIIKANYWKYDQNFYQNLPFGINIYISKDGELFIDPNGRALPDDVIIKRKPNPDYNAIKMKSSNGAYSQEDEMENSIVEEDLSE